MRLYAGTLGVYTGAALGWIAEPSGALSFTLAAGLGAAGYGGVLALEHARPDWDPSDDQTAILFTSSAEGVFVATEAARAIIAPGAEAEAERIVGAGVLGSLAGAGVGLTFQRNAPRAAADGLLVTGSFVGWQAGGAVLGAMGHRAPSDRQLAAVGELAGGALFGAAGAGYAASGAPLPSAAQSAILVADGAWIGAWTPVALEASDSNAPWDGMRIGLAGGYAGALVSGLLPKASNTSLALQGAGFAAGTALGAGIPLGIHGSDGTPTASVVGPMLIGGLAGQAIGGLVAPLYHVSDDDQPLIGLGLGWAGYQAIGWGAYAASVGAEERGIGWALTAGGATGVVATALVPAVDLTGPEVLLTSSSALWGTWYGGWGGYLVGLDEDQQILGTLVLGNAGLLATGAVLAGPADVDWWDVTVIDGLGALGGATGALFGVIASPDQQTIAASSLIGSTAGLVGGALIAARSPAEPVSDLALNLGRTSWVPSAHALPWTDPHGAPGVWVDVRLDER
jgi:hypothetical protein